MKKKSKDLRMVGVIIIEAWILYNLIPLFFVFLEIITNYLEKWNLSEFIKQQIFFVIIVGIGISITIFAYIFGTLLYNIFEKK